MLCVLGLLQLQGCGGCGSDGVRYYKKTSGTRRPYKIRGVWYYPQKGFKYRAYGMASWYGPGFHGKRTATGDIFDMNHPTAAHRELDIPCVCEITNCENGRKLRLVVNDRGPFHKPQERIIDLSRRAAELLGCLKKGVARVHIRCLKKESRILRKKGYWPAGI